MNLIEATINALQGKLEARNPENDEINSKISKTLNGSTKYMDDLDNAGLGVKVNDKGKADSIYNKAEDENNKNAKQPNEYVSVRTMNKQDLKKSNTDTDYYNYLTKNKVRPEVTDTGAFAPTNIIRNSNSFEKTISGSDTTYRQEDRNGVSKAIPKRYKTGRKNYDYNPDVFPKKDYTGVASYEPLDNQELQDFKYNKSKVDDGGWLKSDLDKAKAEYDKAKATYDKVNNQVQDVRSRIAKSKANRKAEARSHKEDNERVAPRDIDKLDVSLGNVGNFAPKNSTGNKYTGTTEAEYRSKRNRTGRKNDDGVDEYITYNNHYDTAVPTYQDFKWNADEFEKEANKYKNDKRGQYATKMMISHQKEADKVVDRVRERVANRKEEARSHKEDNERVAPRTVKNARGNDVETREMVDVSNPAVGNKSYHNEKGSQYWGTTEAEYASKRNKTGQKNEYGYDIYLAPFKNTGDWTTKADRMEPATATAMYQYQKERGELLKPDLALYRDKEKRARNPENKEYWKNAADNIQRNIDDYDTKAKEIIDKEKERIANKKTESTEDVDAKNIEAIQDIIKKSGITNERTVDLMSKDILNDLKRNYTKGCKDEYGNYYGTVITDAFRKKVQQITGKMPDLKIGENRKIKEESIGRNRKIRKKVESSNAPVDGQAYWAYVLGYDFLQDYFKNSGEPECDLTFEKAWEIADDFMHSEEFQDTSKSGYDALVDYLKNRKLIECELNKNTKNKKTEAVTSGQSNMVLAGVTSNPDDSGYRIIKANSDEINICTGSNMLKLLYTIADLMGYGVLSKEAEELNDIPEEIKSELTENSDILYTIENYKLSTLTKFNDTNMTAEDLANYLNS